MDPLINMILDVVLIGLVAAGLVQATRLIRHLAGLRQGRLEMEKFVREFNTAVMRAETGIKILKQTARETGNDLEKLVEKGGLMRDELQLIVASADKIAGRLMQDMADIRPVSAQSPASQPAVKTTSSDTVTPFAAKKPATPIDPAQASRAERELMQALEKLG